MSTLETHQKFVSVHLPKNLFRRSGYPNLNPECGNATGCAFLPNAIPKRNGIFVVDAVLSKCDSESQEKNLFHLISKNLVIVSRLHRSGYHYFLENKFGNCVMSKRAILGLENLPPTWCQVLSGS